MNIKLQDIVENIEGLNDFSKMSLPAATAFKAARLLKRLNEEINIYQQTRTQVITKYAERNADGSFRQDGNNLIIPKDKIEVCNKELQDLLNTEIEVNIIPFKLEELQDLHFTPSQLLLLQNFIEE